MLIPQKDFDIIDGNMNKKTKIYWVIIFVVCLLVAFGLGLWAGKDVNQNYQVPQSGNIDFSLFWDAYNKLQENFIDPSKITNEKVLYGAIEGMAASLGDNYTNFFDPSHAKRFQQDLNGSFSGIGVEIGVKKNILTIISPLKGTPGEKAGLKAGDIIVKIDKKNSIDMTTDDAVNLIRGPQGTQVVLTISREGWLAPKEITVTRGIIKVPSIEWSLKDGNVAYIQIYQFDDNLSSDFKTVAFEILKSPAKKIILDLRNNPGGYLETAKEISSWFLQRDQVITIEDFGNNKEKKTYKTDGSSDLAGYPMVVLINQGSASASEILAGALRDNRGVKLIGMKSFGKGSVQEVLQLKGGSFLKVTIAHWLTPKGDSITDVGLNPDVKVDITDNDAQQKKDPQLDKALEIVKELN